ncbi:unnamed protein product [Cylicocyclus nassatus]|uniref:Uncharacterized protein n=1 Tax=Cylicocyclus nassatus TaxID=53992 RepID=A0AA36H0S5_CYLNA|nr:unnamed protein product [Cylicocyclus nassatus]
MTNDFEMEMYINELWTDPKLKFDHLNACKANLSLDHASLVRVWTPNSCFSNSKIAEIHDSPFSNVFLTLFENGTVWVNYRLRVKGPCYMNLLDFPMDTQSCRLVYMSFSYNNDEVRMRWNTRREPVFLLMPVHIADYTLKDIRPEAIRRHYPAGEWDELMVTFVFERRYMWYFLQAYLPTYFTIFVSWIAFSLGPQAITPRTMIGVNALLSMIFHFGSVMRNLPRVSYVKAIDVWMLSSVTFVFLSLIELAIVGLKERQGKQLIVQRIDRFAQLAFPAAFSIFNIVYWARYGMKF